MVGSDEDGLFVDGDFGEDEGDVEGDEEVGCDVEVLVHLELYYGMGRIA